MKRAASPTEYGGEPQVCIDSAAACCRESSRQQGGPCRGEEPSGDVSGQGMRGAVSVLGVAGCEVGPEGDAADVLHAGPVQPVLEVRLLEVAAVSRATV